MKIREIHQNAGAKKVLRHNFEENCFILLATSSFLASKVPTKNSKTSK